MRRTDEDSDWKDFASHWPINPDVANLNHGSFGPPHQRVREERCRWTDAMDAEPMNFFVRQFEPAMRSAREALATLVGTAAENLAPVDNATYGMNVVANTVALKPGDKVLVNNHEYGAVRKIWSRACAEAGAELVTLELPTRFESEDEVLDTFDQALDQSVQLLVISHITSPTAVILPVSKIVEMAKSRNITTCVDGPHAIAQLDVDIDALECDFYTASCHKWLCAAFGSGFVFVHPNWHDKVRPPILSWGRLLPNEPQSWDEEFLWRGTSNPSAFLTIPAAIEFLTEVGFETFRRRSFWLAGEAQRRCDELFGNPRPIDAKAWQGSMAPVDLPAGDWSTLQQTLWRAHRIEIPVIQFEGKWHLRISCHLHTMTTHIDRLIDALRSQV